ncbi:MAG: septum site-determining protein MinC [Firmicutes bacterium]|jgi:septum site-determining protein MinC|nr:septum site-determining protein MinC [Bacillota bacterium]MDH7494979.1 septum site-determining protein MinC [Bacillota bacterium]
MKTEDVVFKGTKRGLCIILPHDEDFARLKGKLADKLEKTSGFFAGATRAVLDIGELALSEDDVRELVNIVESFGMSVSRVAGGIGLATVAEPPGPRSSPPVSSTPGVVQHRAQEPERLFDRACAGEPQPAPAAREETLLLRGTLRSGQRATFSGNVVVLGDVNPGAEVVAGGDIVVMGALRGVAHAGSPDNRRAMVVALRFMPTQLRIADAIARPPDGESKAPRTPEMARVRGDQIVIEAYSARKAEVEEEPAWKEGS